MGMPVTCLFWERPNGYEVTDETGDESHAIFKLEVSDNNRLLRVY